MSRAAPHEPLPILPQALRRPVLIVTVLAALVVVALGVLFAGGSTPGWFDRALQPGLAESTTGETAWTLAKTVDFAGEPVGLAVLVALLVGVALLAHRPRVAVLVVLGTGLSITMTSALKPLVGRTIHGVFLSYPSGHTASATALAMTAALLAAHRLNRAAALALLYGSALVVGGAAAWAQAGLVAHYPSDTVGGWCTALAVVPATAWLVDHAAARLQLRRSAGTPA